MHGSASVHGGAKPPVVGEHPTAPMASPAKTPENTPTAGMSPDVAAGSGKQHEATGYNEGSAQHGGAMGTEGGSPSLSGADHEAKAKNIVQSGYFAGTPTVASMTAEARIHEPKNLQIKRKIIQNKQDGIREKLTAKNGEIEKSKVKEGPGFNALTTERNDLERQMAQNESHLTEINTRSTEVDKLIKKDSGWMARWSSSPAFAVTTGLGGLLTGLVFLPQAFQGMFSKGSAAPDQSSFPTKGGGGAAPQAAPAYAPAPPPVDPSSIVYNPTNMAPMSSTTA